MTESALAEALETAAAPSLTATPARIANITAPATVELTWTAPDSATVMISGIGVVSGRPQPVRTTVNTTTTFILTTLDSSLLTSQSAAVTVTVTPGFVERLVPSGTISLWSGAIATIPAGWALCDGTAGTPNLLGKFIMGASQGTPPNASGAGDTHTHPVPAFSQTPVTTTNGDHNHQIPTTWYQRGLSCGVHTSIDVNGNIGAAMLQNSGAHAHSVQITFPPSTSAQNNATVYPPSYALCFIMKL